jgi:ParB-like chromosome segregation protein Spo0J
MEPTMSKSPKSPFPKLVVNATLATPNPSNATALPHAPTAPVESVADDVLSMFGDPAEEASQPPAEVTGEAVPDPVAVDEHDILTPADPEVVEVHREMDVADHVDLTATREPLNDARDNAGAGDASPSRVSTDDASTQMDVDGSGSPGVGAVALPAHPAADLFPMLGDEQLAELAEDIRVRGLVEPIVTIQVDGVTLILDGRNRYRACLVAGVEPRVVAWDGTGGSPSGFVLAKNIHRRHLTPSQRAAIAVDLLPLLEAEARERQVAAAEATNARAHLALVEAVPEASSEPVVRGRSRDIAASALGVSGRSVGDAKAIAEAAPEVLVEVKAGNLSIPEGRRIAALPTPEARTKAIKDVKAGTGRKERVPKTVVAPPSVTDTLGPVRAAVGSLGKLLDGIPKTERPIWWAPLRKAIRVVAAK